MKNRNTHRLLVAAVVLVSCLAATIPTTADPRLRAAGEQGVSGWWTTVVTFVTTMFANETAADETDNGPNMDPNGHPTASASSPLPGEAGGLEDQ